MITTFGTAPDGSTVEAIALEGGGLRATVLTWGASLQRLSLGDGPSVTLGCDRFEAYLGPLRYHGAIVGPVANRIAGGRCEIGGRALELDRNEAGRTTLHGGAQGFGERNWTLEEHGDAWCRLSLHHPDGLCGFPGPLDMQVVYRLSDMALEIDLTGRAGAEALCAPAFHGYWNLDGAQTVLGHQLQIAADRYTPVDAQMIPTGVADVAGSGFDYRAPRPVAPDVDHNFCLSDGPAGLREIARLSVPGLAMALETTEPGLQVYSAGTNSSGGFAGLDGAPFGAHKGIALEPQVWPDAVNRRGWHSPRIGPGQDYEQRSIFRFIRTDQ